ncbi:hypothetical protein DL95DRAFT_385096 [Leptodontidium sp. 2 PMI_412]|nr:hypothetical protein DL95DRAFT_385096 [Leptodontidium sp. 2 PMI_412]
MPPRLDLLTKRWSTFELPILPFLAPRVFTPWPCGIRRSHSGPTAPTNPETPRYFWDDGDDLPQKSFDMPPTPKTRRRRPKPEIKAPRNHDLQHSKTVQGGTEEPFGVQLGRDSVFHQTSEPPAEQVDFWAKYEEIWGPRVKKGPPEGPAAPVQRVDEDKRGPEFRMPRFAIAPAIVKKLPIRRVPGNIKPLEPELPHYSPTGFRSPSTNSVPSLRIRRTCQQKLHMSLKQRKAWLAKPKLERIQQQQRLWIGLKRKLRRFKIQMEVRGIAKLRTKFVRVAPEGDFGNFNFSSSWNWRFSMLNARYDKTMKGRVRSPMAIYKNARVSETFIRELIKDRSSEYIRERWTKIPSNRRSRIWPEIMLATLEGYPSQALSVLEATFIPPYPAGYAVSDSLDFVITHYSHNRDSYGAEFLLALSKAIRFFLTEAPADHIHLSQRTLHRLLHIICFDKREWKLSTGLVLHLKRGWIMRNIYRNLVAVGHPMHENTLIQFASALAKLGEIKTACEILQKLKDQGCNFNSPKILSLCSTLLQRAHQKILVKRGGEPPITGTDIFRFVLEAGAEPNIITYNILIKTSLDVGDHQTGWQIHDMMIENGPEPDAHTYSILLNDAKSRMDPSAIRSVIEYVRQNGIRNDWIATDILHAVLLLHQQERQTSEETEPLEQQEPVFSRLLQVYCDHFNVGPLAQIIPDFSTRYPSLVKEAVGSPQDHLLHPTGSTLVVMITGLLDDAQTSYPALQFYEHFRSLVLQNDPVVASLTQTTHVWNLVLKAFGRFPRLLADCSNLIGDMLSAPSQSPVPNETVEAEPKDIAGSDSELPLTPEYAIAASVNSEGSGLAGPQLPVNPEDATPGPVNPGESVHGGSQLALTPDASIPGPLILENGDPESSSHSLFEADSESRALKPLILTPPQPDVYTWSILLKIFMDQHQPRAAEKVLSMMRERGIEPSQVTWNKLAMGYARMQDTVMTVDALRRLEKAGLSADEYTMSAMGMIRNRRALIDAMRREDVGPVAVDGQFLDDLKGKLETTVVEEVEVDADAAVDDADGGLGKIWAAGTEEYDGKLLEAEEE